MANPKNKKCKYCSEDNNDNFYASKHDICKECHKAMQNKRQALKPHLCKCGEKNPKKFSGRRKAQCNKCFNKAQRKREAELIPPPKMSPQEHKEYSENATKVMRDNLKIRREVLYG